MKVEIWSDIMCPWCYIGKRRFERALAQFAHRDAIDVVWKSFQLNPDMKTDPGTNIKEYLADVKGWTADHSQQMHDHVTRLAADEGLTYNFDTAVVANSFDAHRLIQLAKKNGLGDAAEERLFRAYFTEGKNIADHAVLTQLGMEIGLDKTTVKEVLNSNAFSHDVQRDAHEAQQLGARGVPFFVMDRKYGVSGAQLSHVFLETLEKSFAGWREASPPAMHVQNGPACGPDENC